MEPIQYFVMLDCQNNLATPMVDDNDQVLFFDSVQEARETAQENPLGKHFGYEIFERGNGTV